MKLRCLVVDDDEVSRVVMQEFVEKTEFLELCFSCDNAVQASKILENEEVDLTFLDIEMPEMTGLELVKNLNLYSQIVLVTSHEEHAIEAFEHDVLDYIVKPIRYARFLKAANKAKRHLAVETEPSTKKHHVFVKVDSRTIKLYTDDIYMIEGYGDFIKIHTEEDKHVVFSTMKNIITKLPEDEFLYVHRKYIVQLDKIEELKKNGVLIKGEEVPVGNSYKTALKERLNLI
jgi:two-component system LytT family response regulator